MIPPLLAIMSWPLVAWSLFRRLEPARALCWCVIGGFLLLPAKVKFDLPMLPAITKHSMPVFAALFVLFILSRQKGSKANEARADCQPGILPRSRLILFLLLLALAGAMLTPLTNSDVLRYGTTRIPGLRPYDAISQLLVQIVAFLPLLLARKYLAAPEHHRTLMHVFCISMLFYSLPALWEIRMSPQLNNFFYGYANGWRQHVRYGGYRPLVFINHSLWLGIFTSGAVLAAFSMSRVARPEHRTRYLLLGVYLLMVLVLSKTIAALIFAVLLIPAIFLLGTRLQLMVATILAAIVLLFPMLRGAGYVPTEAILERVQNIDAQRAQSLGFRFRNEDILLAKAQERPWVGWGSWGRNRVYNEEGEDISVTDGTWVILIGSNGWIGYISRFGLLTLPIILLFWRRKRYDVGKETSLLCLLLAGNLIDLLPNSSLMPTTWLMAGALIGRLEYQARTSDETPEDQAGVVPEQSSRYARPRPVGARPARGGGVQVARSPYARPRAKQQKIQND